MEPFISYREKDKEGNLQYYVLQREFPHYVGLLTIDPHLKSVLKVPMAGYRFYVSYGGVLMGNYMPSTTSEEDMLVVFQKMADWYLAERILTNQKKYKKWKV